MGFLTAWTVKNLNFKNPSFSHRGWSQYVPNKSKMADGRRFEKKTFKSQPFDRF